MMEPTNQGEMQKLRRSDVQDQAAGAPLSQYFLMFEREAVYYAPDLVLVLVHNDFDESFQFHGGRYTSSFLKIRVEQGRVTEEIA